MPSLPNPHGGLRSSLVESNCGADTNHPIGSSLVFPPLILSRQLDCEYSVASLDRSTRRSLITALLLTAAALIGMGMALPWDYEISRWLRNQRIPGDLRKFIALSEIFAHSLGCAFILGTLWWIDEANRRKIANGALFVLLCGLLSNAMKAIIPRQRPYVFDKAVSDRGAAVWESWGTPWTESWMEEEIRSFPSGHTATAVAMAIALSYAYPKGRPLFFTMAALASLQRIVAGAHYPSDVLFSAALAFTLALVWAWFTHRNPTNIGATHSEA